MMVAYHDGGWIYELVLVSGSCGELE